MVIKRSPGGPCRWRAVNFEIHLWSSGMNVDCIWRSICIQHVQIEAGFNSNPGGGFDLPERARSAGSRTALAPLQFRKMRCQNERKKLARIRYQATCHGIKLESGDLQRFFMIDEIDHVSKKKSHQTVCQRVRAGVWQWFLRGCLSPKLLWPWAENENAETTWRLSLFVWRGGMGAWTLYGDCARQVNELSRCFPLHRNEQSLREVEQMRQAEVKTNYDSGKQTWRSSLAIDEQQWWDLGLNSMWQLRWTSQRIVAAFLFVGETTKAREKLRKLRQTKMEANYEAEPNLTKKALLLKSEDTKFDSRSDINSGSVRSDGSAQGADPLEHCSNGSGSDTTGRTAKSNARTGCSSWSGSAFGTNRMRPGNDSFWDKSVTLTILIDLLTSTM